MCVVLSATEVEMARASGKEISCAQDLVSKPNTAVFVALVNAVVT